MISFMLNSRTGKDSTKVIIWNLTSKGHKIPFVMITLLYILIIVNVLRVYTLFDLIKLYIKVRAFYYM